MCKFCPHCASCFFGKAQLGFNSIRIICKQYVIQEKHDCTILIVEKWTTLGHLLIVLGKTQSRGGGILG